MFVASTQLDFDIVLDVDVHTSIHSAFVSANREVLDYR